MPPSTITPFARGAARLLACRGRLGTGARRQLQLRSPTTARTSPGRVRLSQQLSRIHPLSSRPFSAAVSLRQRPSRPSSPTGSADDAETGPAEAKAEAERSYYSYFPTALPLGPPPDGSFAIGVPALRREFLRLQAQIHPDKQPAERRPVAEAQSARLNEAFRTLADPLQRAQYLLRLRGVDDDETARADDPALLAEVMDAREEIEEAGAEEELAPMRERNEARAARCVRALAESFAGGDVERAKTEVVKLRYWTNIQTALDNWEKGKPSVG